MRRQTCQKLSAATDKNVKRALQAAAIPTAAIPTTVIPTFLNETQMQIFRPTAFVAFA